MNWTGRLGHVCAMAADDSSTAIAAVSIPQRLYICVLPPLLLPNPSALRDDRHRRYGVHATHEARAFLAALATIRRFTTIACRRGRLVREECHEVAGRVCRGPWS